MPVYVVKSNVQRVYGLSLEQKTKLKEQLTFANPKYASALQYSPWGVPKNIPEFLTYYEDHGKFVEVPLHFPLPFPSTVIADLRVKKNVEWPELQVDLREGQSKAFKAFMSNPERGQIVLDTGEGKTILAYAIASALGQKALVLVDRTAYMQPWYDDIDVAFGGAIKQSDIGLIKGNTWRIGKHVTVAFFQTLNNRDLSQLRDEFGIIIHDESDTAAAPTRFNVVSQFKSRYRLAISGTIERSDGLHFLHRYLYGDFSVNLQGQGKDVLVGDQVEIRRVDTKFFCDVPRRYTTFRSFKSNGQHEDHSSTIDYTKLRGLEASDVASNHIKMHYIRGALDQKEYCLVLTHRVFQAVEVFLYLTKKGYKCSLLYGGTPEEVKREIVHKARAGETQCVISTFHYIARGSNIPRFTRGFALTQTANKTELRQAIGRIRRKFKEVKVIKKDGRVFLKEQSKEKVIFYDFYTSKLNVYYQQAIKRKDLWSKMGFLVREVAVPDNVVKEAEILAEKKAEKERDKNGKKKFKN